MPVSREMAGLVCARSQKVEEPIAYDGQDVFTDIRS